MRVFVAGATGVIGRRLVPLLVGAGHDVAGMTRSRAKIELLQRLGAFPIVCDVFDRSALREVVIEFVPEAVVGELTDLPDDPNELASFRRRNDQMRWEGMRNLLEAARTAGARRFLAESIAWRLPGEHGEVVAAMERMALDAGGVVLRYGRLYGPDTFYESELPDPPRARRRSGSTNRRFARREVGRGHDCRCVT